MYLLSKGDYYKLTKLLSEVGFNNLFARSVVEHKVTGKIFVDNTINPSTYYVLHPYGMSLLFGKNNNEEFNKNFCNYAMNISHDRDKHEWMQAFPDDWHPVLNKLFYGNQITSSNNTEKNEEGVIELNTRVNFKFNSEKYFGHKKTVIDDNIKIVRCDKWLFKNMKGSVVPFYFWDSENDFLTNGIGYSLLYKGELASTAFSSYIHGDKLELGIETITKFRAKGFAEVVCSALIDYCIVNDFEPVWSCRLENIRSYNLAIRLGFEPTLLLPYYRLCK